MGNVKLSGEQLGCVRIGYQGNRMCLDKGKIDDDDDFGVGVGKKKCTLKCDQIWK